MFAFRDLMMQGREGKGSCMYGIRIDCSYTLFILLMRGIAMLVASGVALDAINFDRSVRMGLATLSKSATYCNRMACSDSDPDRHWIEMGMSIRFLSFLSSMHAITLFFPYC
ncbi:hypothetical protein F5Y18DRAFT_282965 [Xylariaceae sp. FL1019]|nr:hypothetical protein F5Y18DRAFT_282965 [Xylariaceae sp. FL1019]